MTESKARILALVTATCLAFVWGYCVATLLPFGLALLLGLLGGGLLGWGCQLVVTKIYEDVQ